MRPYPYKLYNPGCRGIMATKSMVNAFFPFDAVNDLSCLNLVLEQFMQWQTLFSIAR